MSQCAGLVYCFFVPENWGQPVRIAIDRYLSGHQIERVCRSAGVALFLVIGMFPLGALWADAVRLTSGQVIEGKIIEESATTIVIRTRNGALVIPRKDVVEVENKGAERIVRLDSSRPDPMNAALWSLVPFYSGLYLGDEPGLGVPFAIAGGIYGMKVLNTLLRKVSYTEWHSDSGRESLYTVSLLHAASRGAADPAYNAKTDPGLTYVLLYDVLRLYPVAGFRVGGRFYEKDELADFRRRTMQRYVLTAALGAGAAYSYFRFLGPGGLSDLFAGGSPRRGPRFLAWYALPVGPREWTAGAVFGF